MCQDKQDRFGQPNGVTRRTSLRLDSRANEVCINNVLEKISNLNEVLVDTTIIECDMIDNRSRYDSWVAALSGGGGGGVATADAMSVKVAVLGLSHELQETEQLTE
ncbi:hypothetical protein J6590_092017 [Homalodisca vitripennis]|nr:hypothetical protein J6590_092017 [Homalodisca vitripennis]